MSAELNIDPERADNESEILAQQVASWRKDVARLNDLIAFAGGQVEAPLTDKPLAYDHSDDYYLMVNARRIAGRPVAEISRMPNWVFAMKLFATGSTSACQICRDAGIDPDGLKVERARSTGKHGGESAS